MKNAETYDAVAVSFVLWAIALATDPNNAGPDDFPTRVKKKALAGFRSPKFRLPLETQQQVLEMTELLDSYCEKVGEVEQKT